MKFFKIIIIIIIIIILLNPDLKYDHFCIFSEILYKNGAVCLRKSLLEITFHQRMFTRKFLQKNFFCVFWCSCN